MHERQELEPEKPPNSFTPVLAYLLGEGDEQLGGFGGIYAARILYETSCDPSPHYIEKLFRVVGDTGNEELKHLLNEIAKTGKETSGQFIDGLADTIEDLGAANLSQCANAIRLAYTINAWRLAGSIRFVQAAIEQLHENDLPEWLSVICESDNFFAYMDASYSYGTGSEEPSDKLAVYRDFINSLDLGDFTGRDY